MIFKTTVPQTNTIFLKFMALLVVLHKNYVNTLPHTKYHVTNTQTSGFIFEIMLQIVSNQYFKK